jgi:6-hydroxynicotinate reductase
MSDDGIIQDKVVDGKIRCDACPVMCYIAEGRTGACDRYANHHGKLLRVDPLVIIERKRESNGELVSFLNRDETWNGEVLNPEDAFVTAIGAGTTYPDFKPAPYIISREIEGVDMITVVTEGIFSYCGAKVKIDTDRHLGPERALVKVDGEPVGHVTTAEYGSQMLSIGGVHHLTGGGKKEGRVTCQTLLDLCNGNAVTVDIEGGSQIVIQSGKPPVVNGVEEKRMRVGCGSATVGMFASQWFGLVDEVVVVDDHITGVISEHQAGKVINWKPSGLKIKGRRSTPGRYFKVAEPGTGWGGTNIDDPLTLLNPFDAKVAKPGQSLLMVSTTGEQFTYYELDDKLQPIAMPMPERLMASVHRIEENCEPALCTVLFMGGAGGSLRSGVVENPVQLTRSVKAAMTNVTIGGAPAYVWPGGGITIMVDVTQLPQNAFGYVPTPALVAPIEFTMRRTDYQAMGGHMMHVLTVEDARRGFTGLQDDHLLAGRIDVKPTHDVWPKGCS